MNLEGKTKVTLTYVKKKNLILILADFLHFSLVRHKTFASDAVYVLYIYI